MLRNTQFAALLFTLLLLGACQSGSGLLLAGTPTPVGTPTPSPPTPTPTPTPVPPPFSLRTSNNILLLGTDRRPDWTNWRTDSIMVLGVDRRYGRAAVLSIPRDLYITVPGYGQARINQVDYIGEKILTTPGGGPALVSQVISDTLGVPTHHWVRVEMRGFRQMVDALGGVTVHLDCPFYELIYDLDEEAWTYFELPAGDVLLDGETAYRFVTLRYLESDFGRSRRQRQFLWALRNQALNSKLLLRVPELWNAFQGTFATDLSLFQMLDLARFALSLDPEDVRAAAITGKELERYITANGADVLRITDPAKLAQVIDHIGEGESLSATGSRDPSACPPKPQGVPAYVSKLLTPTPPPPETGAEGEQAGDSSDAAQQGE